MTLSQLRTQVTNRLDNTGIGSNKIDAWINDANREVYDGHKLPFMETTQAYTLSVGESDITDGNGLPSNFDRAIAVRLTTSDKEKTLTYIQYDVLLQRYPDFENTDDGVPRFWYEFGGEIHVFPSPDTAYTLDLDYYKAPATLSADADEPELLSRYHELIIIGAQIRALEHDDDYDQAAVQRINWQEKHVNMVRKLSQKRNGPTRMAINRRTVSTYVRSS